MWSLRVLGSAVLVTVAHASCDGGDAGPGSATDGGATTTTGSGTADTFVGLDKHPAIARAEQQGRPRRVGREDDEHSALTQDYIEERVTFEIDDGRVTQATFG